MFDIFLLHAHTLKAPLSFCYPLISDTVAVRGGGDGLADVDAGVDGECVGRGGSPLLVSRHELSAVFLLIHSFTNRVFLLALLLY